MARPRKFDEHDVLVAAHRRFNKTGFHGTSVDDLSRSTGLSKGSLYGAFGDKEALFRRVLDDYCAGAEAGIRDLLAGPEDEALDRLRDWLRLPEGDLDRSGCLLARATAELASENDAVADRSRTTFEVLIDTCRLLIEQAQRAGRVDPTADAEVLGGSIVATQRGLESLAKAGVDRATLDGIANAAIDGITLRRGAKRGR